jgi:hypothetical protein
MPDVDVLRELSGQFQRPRFDHLEAVARQRLRRTALGAAAGVAVVALTVGMAAAGLSDGQRTQEPVHQPSPSETSTTGDGWTPERTRAEGSPVPFLGSAPSGFDTQLYCATDSASSSSPCDRYHPYNPDEDQHRAIEVTQGGESALFDIEGTPWAESFDEDSILVQDGTDDAPRFRLLQADGTAVQLRLLSERAPAVPGPDVMLIQALELHRLASIGDDKEEPPYLVDDDAGTLQLLDVPQEIEWWGPNVDEALWGADGCRAIWQQPDGSFAHHDVDCRDGAAWDPGWNWPAFADWLEPGRMALVEWRDNGAPRVVHASMDRGATWERIVIEDRDWGDSLDVMVDALEEALRPLA